MALFITIYWIAPYFLTIKFSRYSTQMEGREDLIGPMLMPCSEYTHTYFGRFRTVLLSSCRTGRNSTWNAQRFVFQFCSASLQAKRSSFAVSRNRRNCYSPVTWFRALLSCWSAFSVCSAKTSFQAECFLSFWRRCEFTLWMPGTPIVSYRCHRRLLSWICQVIEADVSP